jgi:hypothetical protein
MRWNRISFCKSLFWKELKMKDNVGSYDETLIKTILEAIDLVSDVLKMGSLEEDLRIKLAKWRTVAEDLVP